jgi:hypothetical protein
MLDGHGDGREVERLGPIGELWRPEMRLLQAVKLGTNCVYGPFGLACCRGWQKAQQRCAPAEKSVINMI